MSNVYDDPSQAPFEYSEEGAAQIRALLGERKGSLLRRNVMIAIEKLRR